LRRSITAAIAQDAGEALPKGGKPETTISGGSTLKARRFLTPAVLTIFGLTAAPAAAEVQHTVQPGETLWTIAAANNLTTRALAVYNGLSTDSQVVLGGTIKVPTTAEAATALAGTAPAGTATASPGPAGGAAGGPPALGGYTVEPGDTLTGIAARAGVPAGAVAAMNGLAPDAHVIAGTALKLPAGSAPTAAPQPEPTRIPQSGPQPTPGRTNASEIGQIAAEHGVPGSLASAIAWQESGFNNGVVSSANARGVMQVMPGTWEWVQQNLATSQLDPASTHDNVRAGVLYLRQLLKDTGGDQRAAIAAYYQGLGSVQQRGLLPETEQYVNNVQALQGRFGGP
jgi:soluble lytic murein transglycosylase-like protein